MIRIAINLDLEDRAFAVIKRRTDFEGETMNASAAKSPATRQASPTDPLEVILLFARQSDRRPAEFSSKIEAIASACEAIRSSYPDNPVGRILLVDCGDAFMQPLSDMQVLSQYLEEICGRLSTEEESVVYTADFDPENPAGTVVIRDTRSESFVDRMARYTRSALDVLNAGAGMSQEAPAVGVSDVGLRFERRDDEPDKAEEGDPSSGLPRLLVRD